MLKKELISIIIPCFNEEESIPVFYNEIIKISDKMKKVNFEYIFIDDGSYDNTLSILRNLSKKDKRVRYISFSRNFGKEAGMLAGLNAAKGDYAAIMDVDLQDPPEKIIEMYDVLNKEDYDIVALYTNSHAGYSFIRKRLTKLWYRVYNRLSNSKQKQGARDFRLMKRKVIDAIISLGEYSRYIKEIYGYVGFKTKWISYDAPKRTNGTSKFSMKKLIKYAFQGIVATSTRPLLMSIYIGLFLCFISFIAIIAILIKTLVIGGSVLEWLPLASIIVFASGIQLFFLGVVGMYLSSIYLEVKHRPMYVIKETEK